MYLHRSNCQRYFFLGSSDRNPRCDNVGLSIWHKFVNSNLHISGIDLVTTTTRLCPRFCSGARLNTEQPFKFLFYAVTQVLSVKSLQFSQSSCSKYQGISDLNVHYCDILLILLDPHEDARKEASIKYIFVDRKGVVSISLRPTSHQVGHF